MVPTATEAAPDPTSTKASAAPSDANVSGAAFSSAEELAAVEAAFGIEPSEAPAEKPKKKLPADEGAVADADGESRSEAESVDDTGEQAEEASPESTAEVGEESETEGDPEATEDSEWAELLKVAKGDPKRALRLAKALYDPESGEKSEAGEPARPTTRSLKEDVEAFYAEAAGTEGKPGSEKSALLALLERREKAHEDRLAALKADQQAQVKQALQADRDVAALARAYPKSWQQDRQAIQRHYATMAGEGVDVEGLPPLIVYRDLLERRRTGAQARAAKIAAAAKATEAKKNQMAGAAGGAQNGRPVGPTDRQHISTTQREMEAFQNMRSRRRALP